jgi:hypothetical protein
MLTWLGTLDHIALYVIRCLRRWLDVVLSINDMGTSPSQTRVTPSARKCGSVYSRMGLCSLRVRISGGSLLRSTALWLCLAPSTS